MPIIGHVHASSQDAIPRRVGALSRSRNRLLEAERDLRRQVEKVAAMRRKLPLGGRVSEDYVFDGVNGPVKLSELFGVGKSTLILYSFMFGPQMKQPCPMCSSFLDSVNGAAPHVTQRGNLAVVAKTPIARIDEYARSKGWNNLRLVSSANNNYNRDYFGELPDRGQMPSLNVFVKRGEKIHHFYHTELLLMPPDKGQNERHIDIAWPLWNLLDFTPEGRGTDWFPRIQYPPSV
jgi:predicted dithiol-disulfide oxidoreductase (DUF899 family)